VANSDQRGRPKLPAHVGIHKVQNRTATPDRKR
jgi:hypothetical protein